ncbi:DUF262 domain-containing HNH endonuclease family protein [Enterococcus faecium]|uniref:DUF262 domain-containing HNH endonuclease family protein n=1 Tax=Enterococcus faecium TaxID=1352 RepID=UPI0021F093E0|nr:DUF262 domain-containing HNH endonuclease family protein [Enterococcus faecium]MCV6650034.1 DUF262 domain-containing HNH endonuclease family protein [Enterococcus faecium]
MDKNLKMIPVSRIFSNVHYEVPIYQRNYAWETDQIEQLIEDINSSKDDYFLGNLIVNQKENNVYEVIDGQQRLTTLYLLERYLGIPFAKDALRFEAREKSNRTLSALPDTNQLTDELQSAEIKSGFKIIDDYFEKMGLKSEQESFIRRLDKVNLIRVQVPAKIDLNHYFEIMNTRGEQLELHEIAKANFLSKIESKEDKAIANDIWEYCSNMDSYIQMNYPKDKRDKIFNSDWSDLSVKTVNFDSLRSYYHDVVIVDEKMSLRDILQGKGKTKDSNNDSEEPENERFESIISFPNFLLQVNAALTRSSNDDDDSSLDDKNFLINLEKNWKDESSAKDFLFMLLKSRVLFDKFVLKREYARDYKETGKWSLQKLEKYTDNKGNKPKYVGTFGGDEDNRNKQIRTLQSALRITYTSPKTMHWISLILTSCLNNDDSDILQTLEAYGQTKVDASGYTTATGFSFERIVFSYLDYLLYRNGYSYNGKEVVRPLADDWQFQFRSSIEHFYPQHPTELVVWANEDLNCFGNLALITVSGNSTFNNAMPVGKASTNPGIIEQSLKLKIMTEMMRQNDNNWNQELAHKHQREMFNVLEKG